MRGYMTAATWSAPICRRSSKASAHCCICALRDMCIVEPIGGFVLSKTLRKPPERVSDVSSGIRQAPRRGPAGMPGFSARAGIAHERD